MRNTWIIAFLFCAAEARAEDPLILKPKYESGERFVVRVKLDLDVREKNYCAHAHDRKSYLATIGRASQGAPLDQTRTYYAWREWSTAGLPGREKGQYNFHHVGTPVRFVRKSGKVVVVGTPSDKAYLNDAEAWLGMNCDALIPGGPVKLGDKWKASRDPFGRLSWVAGVRGPVTCVFSGMTHWRGRTVAKIAVELRSGYMGHGVVENMGVWVWKGTCYFDPDRGIPMHVELRARLHPDHPNGSDGHLTLLETIEEPKLPYSRKDELTLAFARKQDLLLSEKLALLRLQGGDFRAKPSAKDLQRVEAALKAMDESIDRLIDGG